MQNTNTSKLVLGTVQFGLNYGIANTQGKPSYERARDILKRAYELGIRTLDTAAAYGDSEEVLGRALEELGIQTEMKVVTKIPSFTGVPEIAHLAQTLEQSLRRLRLPKIYGLLYHLETCAPYLPQLREAVGDRVERIGFSVDGYVPRETELAQIIQVPGNVFDRRFLPFLKDAAHQGKAMYCRSVYLQGLLLMPEARIKPALAPLIPYRRRLEKIAAEAGLPLSELAMRYLLSIPELSGVLTGVDTVEQLEANAALAAKGALSQSLFQAILDAIPELPEALIRPHLWPK